MLGQGVGFIGMGLWDFFAAAPANPDPNHGVVANEELLFVQVAFVRLEGVGPVYDEVNASMSSAASMIDSSRFALTSLQRYYGAIADSNAANAELQRQAANAALAQLDVDMLQYRSDLRAISNAVQGTDFAALSATVQDVLDLRDEIVANQSFPSEEDFVFNHVTRRVLEQKMRAVVGIGAGKRRGAGRAPCCAGRAGSPPGPRAGAPGWGPLGIP